MHRAWLKRGRCAMPHLLALVTCLATLTGCASRPTLPAVDCPQPAPVPASLSESSLPDAQAYSNEVASFLSEVQGFLSALQ